MFILLPLFVVRLAVKTVGVFVIETLNFAFSCVDEAISGFCRFTAPDIMRWIESQKK